MIRTTARRWRWFFGVTLVVLYFIPFGSISSGFGYIDFDLLTLSFTHVVNGFGNVYVTQQPEMGLMLLLGILALALPVPIPVALVAIAGAIAGAVGWSKIHDAVATENLTLSIGPGFALIIVGFCLLAATTLIELFTTSEREPLQ